MQIVAAYPRIYALGFHEPVTLLGDAVPWNNAINPAHIPIANRYVQDTNPHIYMLEADELRKEATELRIEIQVLKKRKSIMKTLEYTINIVALSVLGWIIIRKLLGG